MFEINVTVSSPDIVKAISLLVAALRPDAGAAAPTPSPAPVQTQAPTPAPVQTQAPTPAPVTAAPSFTTAQVAKAGADLMQNNPGLQPALVDLIHRYGAQTVQEIPQDKLGAFATELRQMGAKI